MASGPRGPCRFEAVDDAVPAPFGLPLHLELLSSFFYSSVAGSCWDELEVVVLALLCEACLVYGSGLFLVGLVLWLC